MSGKLLLLVDDDQAVVDGLALILSLEGFRVHSLTRGRPVLGTVSSIEPDVVIMDVTLPDSDGVTIARELRRAWPRLPIILMSGLDIPRIVEHVADEGIHVLQKPFEISDLVDLVRRLTAE